MAARALVVAAYFMIWSATYHITNAHGSDPVQTVHLTRPCDLVPGIIQPWTAVLYLAGGLVLPLLPFAYNWSWPKLRFVLACYAVSSTLAFLCYWAWPLGIVRPSFEGPGLGNWLMRQVVAVDGEANCFPSSHVLFAVLGALLVGHGGAGRPVRVAVWALAVAVCATTVTTGQHYFLDVAGGAAFALAGYGVARVLRNAADCPHRPS
jgi:membrane-associated phospholipid phosphatase